MAKRKNRVEVKGSARNAFPGGRDVGPADPSQQIEVTLFLRRGSTRGKFPADAELGAGLPHERKYLTREEFARRHGAKASDLEKVRAFAKQHDLAVVTEDRARRTVKLSGTVEGLHRRVWREPAPLRTSYPAHTAAARAALRFPPVSNRLWKVFSASIIVRKPKRTSASARKRRAFARSQRLFLIRLSRSRRPTHFRPARRAPGSASASSSWAEGITPPTSLHSSATSESRRQRSRQSPSMARQILPRAIPADPTERSSWISRSQAQSRPARRSQPISRPTRIRASSTPSPRPCTTPL